MTIETKYNVGEEVWFMYNDRVNHGKITDIRTFRNGKGQYDANNYGFEGINVLFAESELLPSKQDLLNSL